MVHLVYVTRFPVSTPANAVACSQAKKLVDTGDLLDSFIPLFESSECKILIKTQLDTPIITAALQIEQKPIMAERDQLASAQFSEIGLPSAYSLQVLKLVLLYLLLPTLFYRFQGEVNKTGVGAVLLHEDVAGVDHLVDRSNFVLSQPPIGRTPSKMCPERSLDVDSAMSQQNSLSSWFC